MRTARSKQISSCDVASAGTPLGLSRIICEALAVGALTVIGRRTLATSRFLVDHKPRTFQSDQTEIQQPPADASLCAHYFVDPLSWMRPELEQGKLDGRLECPKCKTNVGKYAWQGMKCSCNEWVVPAISISKGRIDEIKSRTGAGSDVAGIRRPPAVLASPNRGPGTQNL